MIVMVDWLKVVGIDFSSFFNEKILVVAIIIGGFFLLYGFYQFGRRTIIPKIVIYGVVIGFGLMLVPIWESLLINWGVIQENTVTGDVVSYFVTTVINSIIAFLVDNIAIKRWRR